MTLNVVTYPQCLIDDSPVWGVWQLAIDEDGQAYKKQVHMTGRAPDVSRPETLVNYEVATAAIASMSKHPLSVKVQAYLKEHPKATAMGHIWLIQPGFIVLDYDDLVANPGYTSLCKANETWTEMSSRGNGLHQIFSCPAEVAGVIAKVVDGIDARGAGTFLYMTGRSNPAWPDIQPLTPYFEDVISAKSRENAELRAQANLRHGFVGEEVADEYLIEKFKEDPEALAYAKDPQQQLNSDVMRVFVQRLSRYSADADQMRRVFLSFPCADEANITKPKRQRKVTDLVSLFDLHYNNMVKNNSLELPMVTFNLSMGQEVVAMLPPPTIESVVLLEPPPLPKNMRILAEALNRVSEVAFDVSTPSIIQLTRMLAGDRLLCQAVYLSTGKAVITDAICKRPIVHFFTLANSGRGKSRAYRRIRDFARLVSQTLQAEGSMGALPLTPVRDMGKGLQGANKLAASISLFEKQAAAIGLVDEAEANFATSNDPGGAKAFLKEFTENVCAPGATTSADKNTNSGRVDLQDYVVQLAYLSTIKAMKPVLMQHLGDGLLARLVLWVSNEPAIDANSWNGKFEVPDGEVQIDLSEATNLVRRYTTSPTVTVLHSQELLRSNVPLVRRLLELGTASKGDGGDAEEDAFNRYITYAQYLSAIYAWSEEPESASHTVESLEWGIAVMEFVKQNAQLLFKSIARTVDTTTHQAKHAMNTVNQASRYELAIIKFYTEGTDLDAIRELLRKASRLSTTLDKSIQSRVLTVGLFSQYTARFFGLSRPEISTQGRDEALKSLVGQGIIELRTPGGIPLGITASALPADTQVYIVQQSNEE